MNGFIKNEDIEEVRERSNLVEVVSEYVTLKKAGRSFKGLCPFHKEKTPSFVVDPAKQLYHCFGCGEGGNVFTFIMKMDNLEFPEAVKSLADRYGYTLHYERTAAARKRLSVAAKIYEINSKAADFYHQVLKRSNAAYKAREYLESRGYTKNIVDFFKLGFALPEWDSLLRFMHKEGYAPEDLEKAGLAIRKETGSYYDRFRGRIIFPTLDIKGRVVGFGGRACPPLLRSSAGKQVLGDQSPKYLNSPETPVYRKSTLLYGLYYAKDEILRQRHVLVVEGYTDVISLYRAGIRNVVATLGTAFTSDHVHLLARFTDQIKLVFDADQAGKAAAERGLELLREAKVSIRVVTLPAGNDPADYVTKNGPEAFKAVTREATLLIDFCLREAVAGCDITRSEERVKAAEKALPIVAALPNAVAQEEYLKKLAEKLNVSEQVLLVELKKLRQPKSFKETIPEEGFLRLDAQELAEREMLKFVLLDSDKAEKAFSELNESYFVTSYNKELFSILKSHFERKHKLEAADLLNEVRDEKVRKLVSRLIMEGSAATGKKGYFEDILLKLKEFTIQRQINKLKTNLEKLDPVRDQEKHDLVFRELLDLEKEKRNLQL